MNNKVKSQLKLSATRFVQQLQRLHIKQQESCSGVSNVNVRSFRNGGVTNITLTPLEGSEKQLGKVNKLGNALQR